MYNIRTDLAIEARDIYQESSRLDEIPGIESEDEELDGINITRVRVTSEEGEKAIGKRKGTYITLESSALRENNPEEAEKITNALTNELKKLLGDCENKSVLVAGLGNSRITPDSIGPKTVSNLVVTRHLFSAMPSEFCDGLSHVCAIAPGVLGVTGIETGEIIKGVTDRVQPDFIIAVDALASRKMDRVSTTVQISDTGIIPGGGVKNARKEISKSTLGIPVIAIGIPTVVDLASITNDCINIFIENLQQKAMSNDVLNDLKNKDNYGEIQEALDIGEYNMIVTPKEIDELIEKMKDIVSKSINKSF